jgi:hypothetical protein
MSNHISGVKLVAIVATMLMLKPGLAEDAPQFDHYPAKDRYRGRTSLPLIRTPEERENQAVITDGMEKGWGVFDGTTGQEMRRPGPNFAGHYTLISFGCGDSYSNLLCVAIVDTKTGQIFRQPLPQSGLQGKPFAVLTRDLPAHPYSSFHNFTFKSPIRYRLNSRLLIVDTCESYHLAGTSIIQAVEDGCGNHYYVMEESGLKLIYRTSR